MTRRPIILTTISLGLALVCTLVVHAQKQQNTQLSLTDQRNLQLTNDRQPHTIYRLDPKPISTDASVRYDYDIVYVRAPRKGDNTQIQWADVFLPTRAEPGSDLILLHPNGKEEMLVEAGNDAIADPMVSFDGQWVYYARIHNIPKGDQLVSQSADIFKIHVNSRKIVQLTHQEFTPNTGVADPHLAAAGVYNMGPCPIPGGKIIFTSNRNGFISTKSYLKLGDHPQGMDYTTAPDLQLFVMDDDGKNIEETGFLNINGALHPNILKDGRIMFTTFESEGLRDPRTWGIWTIHPDGTVWAPFVSALGPNTSTADHFMTQLSDQRVVWEEYYFEQALGFGTFYSMNASAPDGYAFFGSAARNDPRNLDTTVETQALGTKPFTPSGLTLLTRFAHPNNAPAYLSDYRDPDSPRVGRVTHPSAAPDDNLLLVWSPGPVHGHQGGTRFDMPAIDSGIYMIKGGKVVEDPSQMLLIKNDPRYDEQWPRALVSYQRIYGVPEPAILPSPANDGKLSKELPEGSPYGLIGSSSLYKRESYPLGTVAPKEVTAKFSGSNDSVLMGTAYGLPPAGGADPYQSLGGLFGVNPYGNWFMQGADDGKYSNDEIHAIRILITEPTTDPAIAGTSSRRWWNIADERFRILGEFPVRKFKNGKQPVDPDGNPDTSFLVKLPANVAWTFQTLDKNGMVLNMAETWHQVRPGEIRNDCGGCHAHSQTPTKFEETAAAKPDYPVFDLTKGTWLLTSKKNDQTGKQWDANNETGLHYQKNIETVEFYRDVKPILDRSCVACHTQKWAKPAGNLVLDDYQATKADESLLTTFGATIPEKVPGTYLRLAFDPNARWGYKLDRRGWVPPQASRYVRYFQSRRSLLAWKIYGQRLDGFQNDDFAYETKPGDPSSMIFHGKPYDGHDNRVVNLGYTGTAMPPPDAVAGTFVAPDGQKIQVPGLSDEDRRTIVRWIDLGCPIDLDFDAKHPDALGHGWSEDDSRPTLVLTSPREGANHSLSRILIGMNDYESGLDVNSLRVTANFSVNGVAAGQNLAAKFKIKSQEVWELPLDKPIANLTHGTLSVSVKDKAGNISHIQRSFTVAPDKSQFTAMK